MVGTEEIKKVSLQHCVENRDLPIEKIIKKIDNLQDKVKFTAFGKTRIKGIKKVGEEGTITTTCLIMKAVR